MSASGPSGPLVYVFHIGFRPGAKGDVENQPMEHKVYFQHLPRDLATFMY